MATPTDRPGLVARIQAGDPDALRELVASHKEEVCRAIRTLLRGLAIPDRTAVIDGREFRSQVDSVFNAALISVVDQIRSGRATWEDGVLLRYMIVTARNLMFARGRRSRRERSAGAELLVDVAAPDSLPEAVAEERQLVEKCRALVSGMSERCQMLIALRLDEGLSFNEIGEVLKVKPNSASARYAECLAELRRLGHELLTPKEGERRG